MKTAVSTESTRLIFNALGDESRFRIVELLKQGDELCVSQVAEAVGITTAGASQHMKVLEKAGLISPKRMGQRICYQLNKDSEMIAKIMEIMEEK